jgi:opacity protein-like surface antigen
VAKCTRIVAATCLTLLAAGGTKLHAQSRPQFGPQLNFASNSIGIGIGARVWLDMAKMIPTARNIGLIGSFDYFFPGTGFGVSASYWELNANGTYSFAIPKSPITPYAGAGLNVAHFGYDISVLGVTGSYSHTDIGLNLLGGAKFGNLGKVTPFGELRLELHSGSAVVITGGVLF